MIDLNLIRINKELVKENIKRKFQDYKLPLVDEVLVLDEQYRQLKQAADKLRETRNNKSSEIGHLVRTKKLDEVNKIKEEVNNINHKLETIEVEEKELKLKINEIMLKIPNLIAKTVPLGKDGSENVERERFGEQTKYDYEIPYHLDIIEKLGGIDLDNARLVSGSGFYYLIGDVARLHSAILAYARDFMIEKGFLYVIPPFMVKGNVVNGVMSFEEQDAMMYKIEGEDLYLIGTSEHSMIGKFKDSLFDVNQLPIKMTSYSPCFRKEKGAHGIEERGIYRVHQFEKQEMIVICHPKESDEWYIKMWNYTVEIFRNLNIPVRTLECCTGDLADLKYESLDIEAWSPRQKKYFEVASCSNLTDAQSRRLGIRIKDGKEKYYAHTLNNTVVASPRMLISFLENNLNKDGSIYIPKVLRSYMGGIEKIVVK